MQVSQVLPHRERDKHKTFIGTKVPEPNHEEQPQTNAAQRYVYRVGKVNGNIPEMFSSLQEMRWPQVIWTAFMCFSVFIHRCLTDIFLSFYLTYCSDE